MFETIHILADGIPPGVIFAIFVVAIIAIANVAAKMKQTKETQDQMRRQREIRQGEIRQGQRPARTIEEIVQEQFRHGEQRRQQQQQKSTKRKAKQNRPTSQPPRAAPPPMPVASPARVQAATTQREPDEVASPSRPAPGEAARNVRLMLQPSGIREAFVLSEVLGKPKSLRDE